MKRDITTLMCANGFVLVRASRHLIWRRGRHQIVTAVSPSCCRVLKNIEAMIRRLDAAEGRA